MYHIRIELPIVVDIQSRVSASTEFAPNITDDIPKYMECVGDTIVATLKATGFKEDDRFTPTKSTRNDGYSLYSTFGYAANGVDIKLVLTIRLSDHASQPSLSTGISHNLGIIEDTVPDVKLGKLDASVLDIYCKQRGLDTLIYVGTDTDSEYRAPIRSMEQFTNMLNGKLRKLISKYS